MDGCPQQQAPHSDILREKRNKRERSYLVAHFWFSIFFALQFFKRFFSRIYVSFIKFDGILSSVFII